MLMTACSTLQASLDAGTALAALSAPDPQSELALKHDAMSCTTAKQLVPADVTDTGLGSVEPAAQMELLACLDLRQSDLANSHPQPLLPKRSGMPEGATKAEDSVKTSLGISSAGDASEQLQAALKQAQNAPQPPGNALTDVSTQVHDLGQSFRSMLQRMNTLEATLDGMRQQQQQPENRLAKQIVAQQAQRGHIGSQHAQHGQGEPPHAQQGLTGPQHAQYSQDRSQHAQQGHTTVPVDEHHIVEAHQGHHMQAAAEHPQIRTPAGQRQHSMHGLQLEPVQAVKQPVRFLRGAIRQLHHKPTPQAAPTVHSNHPDVAMHDACPDDICGRPQPPSKQLLGCDNPGAADRQESAGPQVLAS